MRQIKFRGYAPIVGRYVYGDLWQRNDGKVIFEGVWYRVEPKSVAQLVGLDANGQEVYEGDTVIRVAGEYGDDFDAAKAFPFAATFEDYGAILRGEIILVEAAQ